MRVLKGCGIAILAGVLALVAVGWVLYNLPGWQRRPPKGGIVIAKGAWDVRWIRGGKSLCYRSGDRRLRRYSIGDWRPSTADLPPDMEGLSLSPDGHRAVGMQYQPYTPSRVIVADLATGDSRTIFSTPGRVRDARWLPGDLILVSVDLTDYSYRPCIPKGSTYAMRPDGSNKREILPGSRARCLGVGSCAWDGSAFLYIWSEKKGSKTAFCDNYLDLRTYKDKPCEFVAREAAEGRCVDVRTDVFYLSRNHVIYRSICKGMTLDDEIRVRDLRTMKMHVLPFPGIFSVRGGGLSSKQASIDGISPDLRYYHVTVQMGHGEFAPPSHLWLVKLPNVTRKRLEQLGVTSEQPRQRSRHKGEQ